MWSAIFKTPCKGPGETADIVCVQCCRLPYYLRSLRIHSTVCIRIYYMQTHVYLHIIYVIFMFHVLVTFIFII